MEKKVLDELLTDELIMPRVKVECLLMPMMGLRPVSQVTIPAEMPGGPDMGRRIDEAVGPLMSKLRAITDPKAKVEAINAIKKLLEKQFEEVVEGSEPYKAYYDWTDKLGLKSEQSKVRPTVHEIFVLGDGSQRKELRNLLKDRDKLRARAHRRPDPKMGGVRFAYPEEFNAKWITRMGRQLGYPDCCVRQYALDRVKGVNVEVRAAQQLVDKLKAEEKVDAYSYPLGYFFPCRPDCPNSAEMGRKARDRLAQEDGRLGEMYGEMLKVNVHMVLRQPELIQRYISLAQKQE